MIYDNLPSDPKETTGKAGNQSNSNDSVLNIDNDPISKVYDKNEGNETEVDVSCKNENNKQDNVEEIVCRQIYYQVKVSWIEYLLILESKNDTPVSDVFYVSHID